MEALEVERRKREWRQRRPRETHGTIKISIPFYFWEAPRGLCRCDGNPGRCWS